MDFQAPNAPTGTASLAWTLLSRPTNDVLATRQTLTLSTSVGANGTVFVSGLSSTPSNPRTACGLEAGDGFPSDYKAGNVWFSVRPTVLTRVRLSTLVTFPSTAAQSKIASYGVAVYQVPSGTASPSALVSMATAQSVCSYTDAVNGRNCIALTFTSGTEYAIEVTRWAPALGVSVTGTSHD